MNIFSLEDDESFWNLLKEALESEFRNIHLSWIRTESDFYYHIPDFIKTPPDLFLLDVMVKWADASEKMPTPPKDVEREKYFRAGLRCRKRLLEDQHTASIPVILYTVLEQVDMDQLATDLPKNTWFAGKTADFRNLIPLVKQLGGVPHRNRKSSS
jgi:hypothetical protein